MSERADGQLIVSDTVGGRQTVVSGSSMLLGRTSVPVVTRRLAAGPVTRTATRIAATLPRVLGRRPQINRPRLRTMIRMEHDVNLTQQMLDKVLRMADTVQRNHRNSG